MSNLQLIRSWHEKAKEDYFSRYIFEYLAFEAYLKKYKYAEGQIVSAAGNQSERSYIQHLKNEQSYTLRWAHLLDSDSDLQRSVEALRDYLLREPLLVRNNWWGCNSYQYAQCAVPSNAGIISSNDNFGEIVEFWYYVRNNLFHATKDPNDARDEKLVTYAYLSLSVFMEKVLLPEMEHRIMVPAIWEEFSYKFFKGEAEATLRINRVPVTTNVYELLYIEDDFFPILFEGQMIDRQYIIEKLSFNLINLAGDETLCEKEWRAIISRAQGDVQKAMAKDYFRETIDTIKQTNSKITFAE